MTPNKSDILLMNKASWLSAKGPEHDVVISSRVRIARNIKGFFYSHRLSAADQNRLIDLSEKAFQKSAILKSALLFRNAEMTDLDRQFLVERHLISKEHASGKAHKSAAITPSEDVSVMVLEEDHYRIQAFESGLNLEKVWQLVNHLDDELAKEIPYAFSPTLGYLTACPTNVGTGLRASCMLHIPSLVITKQIHKVLQALTKLNLATRGLYGEGTQAIGDFFQFSNQMTLGQSEEEIIGNLVTVIHQVIDHEREARQYLKEKKKNKFEDQMWRALGILKACRTISSTEATQHLSLVQLGMNMDLIKTQMTAEDMNQLFLWIQPAHLQKVAGGVLNTQDRDVRRAEIIRQKLAKVSL